MAVEERVSIERLRALIGKTEGVRKKETLISTDLSSGLPRGALIEVTGDARTEWVVRLLSENPTADVAWVEDQLSIFPPAIQQRKMKLERIIFFETQGELNSTICTLLRSQIFTSIVIQGDIHDQKTLRRYQLLAEKSNSTLILISKKQSSSWCISIQVEVTHQKDSVPQLRILKFKG